MKASRPFKDKKPFSVRLSGESRRRLHQAARREAKTVTQVLEEVILAHVPGLPDVAIPFKYGVDTPYELGTSEDFGGSN
jgi:hypothetical protein